MRKARKFLKINNEFEIGEFRDVNFIVKRTVLLRDFIYQYGEQMNSNPEFKVGSDTSKISIKDPYDDRDLNVSFRMEI